MSLYDEMEEHNTLYGGMSCPLSEWAERVKALQEENADLRRCCCQRGARMQILREYIDDVVWYHDVLYERPGAEDWFDSNGVTK